MKRAFKSSLSLLLCGMLVFMLLPTSAMAASNDSETAYQTADGLSVDILSTEEMATSSLSQLYQGTDVGTAVQEEGETVSEATPVPTEPTPDAGENTPTPIISITITLPEDFTSLTVGETVQLSAVILPLEAQNEAFYWLSSNEDIAIVDETGLVSAVASGSVEITATATEDNTIFDKIDLVVEETVENIPSEEPLLPEESFLPDESSLQDETPLPDETPLTEEAPLLEEELLLPEDEGLLDGNWRYRIDENGYAFILGYLDSNVSFLRIPDLLGGCFVVGIDDNALKTVSALTRIRIHGNITNIGSEAFPENVEIEAYHGAYALTYALDNGFESNDLSEFYFIDGVVDYSDIQSGRYAFAGDTTIRMKPLEASRLSIGSVFYLPASEKYPNGEGFIVESIEDGSWVTLNCVVARGEEIIERIVVEDAQLTADWDNAILSDGVTLVEGSDLADGTSSKSQQNTTSRLIATGQEEYRNVGNDYPVTTTQSVKFYKEVSSSIKIYGEFKIDMSAKFNADIQVLRGKIKELNAVTTETISGSAGIEFKAFGSKPLSFELFRVPLVGNPLTNVYVDVGIVFELSASGECTYKFTLKRGFEWSNSLNKPIGIDETSHDWDLANIKGELKVGFFISVGLDMVLVGDIFEFTFSIGFKKYYDLVFKLKIIKIMTATLYKKEIQLWDKYLVNGVFQDDPPGYILRDSYKVKFISATGIILDPQYVVEGNCATQPLFEYPTGATLLGWYLSDGTKWDFNTIVDADMTLYAKWQYADGIIEGGSTAPPSSPTPTPAPTMTLLYTLSDGTATIIGYSGTPSSPDLIIPSYIDGYPVVAIADEAFSWDKAFTGNLIIQSGVETIGSKAFWLASFTGSLSLPDSITSIGASAFQAIDFTGQLVLPERVETIGGFAFSGCSGFTGELELPIDISSIGRNAFTGCSGFTGTLRIPESVTMLDYQVFEGCSGFANLVLPETLETIKVNAFKNCTGLTGQLILPDSVTSLWHEAFGGCTGLTGNIYLPAGLMSIPCNPFNGCYNLVDYIDNPENMYFKTYNGLILNKSGTRLYSCMPSKNGELPVPYGVTYINQSSFYQCSELTVVYIPSTMRTIAMHAFDECTSLTRVDIASGTTSIEYMAFANCPNLTTISIPQSVLEFEHDIFVNSPNVTIYGVADSPVQTYAESNGIPFVSISAERHSVTFDPQGGAYIETLSYTQGNLVPAPADPIRSGYEFTGWYLDSSCTVAWDFDTDVMPDADLVLYAGWRTANSDIQYEINDTNDAVTITGYIGALRTLYLPSVIADLPVTAIADYAFAECDLYKLVIPASITSIGDNALYGCESLGVISVASENPSYIAISNVLFDIAQTRLLRYAPLRTGSSYTIPTTVTQIGSYAFYACKMLTSISIPDGLLGIGSNAFMNCTRLSSLTFSEGIDTLGSSLFYGCDSSLQLFGPVADCEIKTYSEENYLDYNLYSVNFYNGTEKYHSRSVRAGDLLPETQEPEDDVLRFEGWCTDSSCSTQWNFETDVMPASDLNLYLRWGCDYTVSGDTNLVITGYTGTDNFLTVPSSINGDPVVAIEEGAFNSTEAMPIYEIVLPSTITTIADGAITWTSAENKPVIVCDAGSTAEAYASANLLSTDAIEYSISFEVGGGLAATTQMVAPGAKITQPTTQRDNYTLEGWYMEDTYTNTWDFSINEMPAANLVLYAKWVIIDDSIPDIAYTYRSENSEVTITGYIGTTTFATIPSSINGEPVTAIADFFLQNDTRVQRLTIPSSVTSIGAYAFQNSALAEVIFESGSELLSISDSAFYGCSYLTSISIERSLSSLGCHVFHGCTGLLSFDLPDGIADISDGTFYGCANIREITIPQTVTNIGVSAFANCYDLQNVLFNGQPPTELTNDAFRNCSDNLTLIYYKNTNGWTAPTYTYTDGEGVESTFNTAMLGDCGYISSLIPNRVRGVLGQTIQWTAVVSDTDESLTYQFVLYLDGSEEPIDIQAYSESNVFSFVPQTVGVYQMEATAKDATGNLTSPRCSVVTITAQSIPVTSISLDSTSLSLNVGNMQQLTADIAPEDATNQNIVWTSSNANVATVAESGVITALAMGTTIITATTASGLQANCQLVVSINLSPQILLVTETNSITINTSVQLTPQYRYFDDLPSSLIWESSNPVVATVDETGIVACLSLGETTIRVTSNDDSGIFAELTLTIVPALVEQVDILNKDTLLAVGSIIQLSTSVLPDDAGDSSVTWSIIGGEEYASINPSTGVLTGLSAGTVTIKATANDGGGVFDTISIEIVDYSVDIDFEDLDHVSTLWIDGVACPVDPSSGIVTVPLANDDAMSAVAYNYNNSAETDIHKIYPTGMTVWLLEFDSDSGQYTATRAPYFDDLLRYSGCSIRITGTKGIRMITSLTSAGKAALTSTGLNGWTLLEYGTAVAWASAMGSDSLVLGRSYTLSNYAYKKDVADPVFATINGLTQYTNVLVGFNIQQCGPDLAQRPYIKLQNDLTGQEIVLYGGTVYRSIGYIAYQNRNAFSPGTTAYEYVWEIIHAVYGTKFDDEYKS
jgi:uncharacterized repeat protein (TIGR02543 family)